eukprot:5080047-Heterocapsa_arctica.AAC.1
MIFLFGGMARRSPFGRVSNLMSKLHVTDCLAVQPFGGPASRRPCRSGAPRKRTQELNPVA